MVEFNFVAILETLVRHNVKFVLVGGIAATLQGVDVSSLDVDVVHSRSPENFPHLAAALVELDAWYRMRTDRKLTPSESHLASSGHQLLATNHGCLDLLGTIDDGLGYEELKTLSKPLLISPGVTVEVLRLEKLLEIKERCGREKDKAMLPMIRATIAEKKKLQG